jgi:hypothetical protein
VTSERVAAPPPPEFVELCKLAKSIGSLEDVRFAATLYTVWSTTSGAKLRAWWESGVLSQQQWLDGLIEFSATPIEKRQSENALGYYVGIVKNPSGRFRYERAEAQRQKLERPTPIPPVFVSDQPRSLSKPLGQEIAEARAAKAATNNT